MSKSYNCKLMSTTRKKIVNRFFGGKFSRGNFPGFFSLGDFLRKPLLTTTYDNSRIICEMCSKFTKQQQSNLTFENV